MIRAKKTVSAKRNMHLLLKRGLWWCIILNGFDRKGQQILDQPDLLLQEWFCVCDAAEHPIETTHRLDAASDLRLRRKQIFARLLIAELCFIGEDRGKLAFECIADVDNKGRADVVVEGGVNDLERTVRSGTAADRTGS